MSDNQGEYVDGGEVSEIDRLRPGGIVDEGDPTPYAEYANQTEDGAPKNYGTAHEDESLPPPQDAADSAGDERREALRDDPNA